MPGEPTEQHGIVCRRCGSLDLWTSQTSATDAGIRRKRICQACGAALYTIEWADPNQRARDVRRHTGGRSRFPRKKNRDNSSAEEPSPSGRNRGAPPV